MSECDPTGVTLHNARASLASFEAGTGGTSTALGVNAGHTDYPHVPARALEHALTEPRA